MDKQKQIINFILEHKNEYTKKQITQKFKISHFYITKIINNNDLSKYIVDGTLLKNKNLEIVKNFLDNNKHIFTRTEVADKLNISVQTLRNHVNRLPEIYKDYFVDGRIGRQTESLLIITEDKKLKIQHHKIKRISLGEALKLVSVKEYKKFKDHYNFMFKYQSKFYYEFNTVMYEVICKEKFCENYMNV